MAWLVLRKGVSRDTANITLRAFRLIISSTVYLIYLALKGLGLQVPQPSPIVGIRLDTRTVYSVLDLDPHLIRNVCCPKCFKHYPADTQLRLCDFKKSPKGRKCKTPLFRTKETQNGKKRVPYCLYTTQSFQSWLEYLLSRPKIEACLHQTYSRSQGNWRPGERMRNIYDSPAWQEHMRDFLKSPYHLAFAIYLDWFNPLGNKIAGTSQLGFYSSSTDSFIRQNNLLRCHCPLLS